MDLTDAYEAGADDWTVQEAFEISLSKVSLLIMPRP